MRILENIFLQLTVRRVQILDAVRALNLLTHHLGGNDWATHILDEVVHSLVSHSVEQDRRLLVLLDHLELKLPDILLNGLILKFLLVKGRQLAATALLPSDFFETHLVGI